MKNRAAHIFIIIVILFTKHVFSQDFANFTIGKDEFDEAHIYDLVYSDDEILYVATTNGLYSYSNSKFIQHQAPEEQKGTAIFSLNVAENGDVFYTNLVGQIFRCRNNKVALLAEINPNLTCIQVDDIAYSTANWTSIDAQTSFNINCGGSSANVITEDFEEFSIYPNPVEQELRVATTFDIHSIAVFNPGGKLIFKGKGEILNLAHLDTGIYFLKIHTSGGVFSRKIVKK